MYLWNSNYLAAWTCSGMRVNVVERLLKMFAYSRKAKRTEMHYEFGYQISLEYMANSWSTIYERIPSPVRQFSKLLMAFSNRHKPIELGRCRLLTYDLCEHTWWLRQSHVERAMRGAIAFHLTTYSSCTPHGENVFAGCCLLDLAASSSSSPCRSKEQLVCNFYAWHLNGDTNKPQPRELGHAEHARFRIRSHSEHTVSIVVREPVYARNRRNCDSVEYKDCCIFVFFTSC